MPVSINSLEEAKVCLDNMERWFMRAMDRMAALEKDNADLKTKVWSLEYEISVQDKNMRWHEHQHHGEPFDGEGRT